MKTNRIIFGACCVALAAAGALAQVVELRDVPLSTPVDTNALARLGEIRSWDDASIVISNGVMAVWVGGRKVWEQADAVSSGIEDEIRRLAARVEALESGGGARDWNSYAADGSANPDPGFMTILNRPATMIGSGFAWETSGAFSVLAATGTVAFASDEGGGLRIGPSSTNWFGYVTGGSYVIGARCRSLVVTEAGSAGGVATMSYDYDGGGFPTLWFAPSLDVDFAPQEGVVWVDSGDGTAVVTAPATTPRGFWYATTTATFDTVFRSTMPARFDGGMIGDTNTMPVIYDSTITVESGGRFYRIPAEAVR